MLKCLTIMICITRDTRAVTLPSQALEVCGIAYLERGREDGTTLTMLLLRRDKTQCKYQILILSMRKCLIDSALFFLTRFVYFCGDSIE
mmetsp:Transcript_18495/g.27946  ORF Transcript_18495/g.27946 Transcript_18495/m.27946 type:complete len:89 (+) Transcript_18495:1125-1391(+)